MAIYLKGQIIKRSIVRAAKQKLQHKIKWGCNVAVKYRGDGYLVKCLSNNIDDPVIFVGDLILRGKNGKPNVRSGVLIKNLDINSAPGLALKFDMQS